MGKRCFYGEGVVVRGRGSCYVEMVMARREVVGRGKGVLVQGNCVDTGKECRYV